MSTSKNKSVKKSVVPVTKKVEVKKNVKPTPAPSVVKQKVEPLTKNQVKEIGKVASVGAKKPGLVKPEINPTPPPSIDARQKTIRQPATAIVQKTPIIAKPKATEVPKKSKIPNRAALAAMFEAPSTHEINHLRSKDEESISITRNEKVNLPSPQKVSLPTSQVKKETSTTKTGQKLSLSSVSDGLRRMQEPNTQQFPTFKTR